MSDVESTDPTAADPFGAVALDPALADATAVQQQSELADATAAQQQFEGSTEPETAKETEEVQKDASSSSSGTLQLPSLKYYCSDCDVQCAHFHSHSSTICTATAPPAGPFPKSIPMTDATAEGRKLYVAGLLESTGETAFRGCFSVFGELEDCMSTHTGCRCIPVCLFSQIVAFYFVVARPSSPTLASSVVKDKYTGISRCFGFVTYKERSSVDRALAQPIVLEGKQVLNMRYVRDMRVHS
jgi:hypothetical protein